MKNILKCLLIASVITCKPVFADALVEIDGGVKAKQSQPRGCVVGSIGRAKNGMFDQKSINLRMQLFADQSVSSKRGSVAIEYVSSSPSSFHNDYNDSASFGQIFSVCVKPGKYYLFRVITLNRPLHSELPVFTVPINIEEGKSVYIGSFSLDNSGKMSACRPFRGPLYVRIEDKNERDAPLIMKSKSKPASTITVNVLQPEAADKSLVRCPAPDTSK